MSTARRPFTSAWLAGETAACALLPAPTDPAARAAAVHRAAGPVSAPVMAALRAATPDPHPAQAAHLAALACGEAACVVTGQQAGLFGGPLYTLHKAASVIAHARALTDESGRRCVPVFWLQSEDHDFAEIATCHLVDQGHAPLAVSVPGDPAEADRSVGARRLGPPVEAALDRLAHSLPDGPHRAATLALLRQHYRPDASPVAAFAGLMDALFRAHGLLLLDPRAPGLAAAARPVHRFALDQAGPIAAALTARARALAEAGFKVQVHVRPRAPLSFYHPAGPDGPRARLVPDGPDAWALPDGARLPRAGAGDAPGHFSTSALLRPLLQDTWLPTAAYVGGPGEIAYLAQVGPLYPLAGQPQPLAIHRNRFWLTTPALERTLGHLGLGADDLSAPRAELLTRLGTAGAGQIEPAALAAALIEPLSATLDDFAPTAAAVDRGLAKAATRARRRMARLAERLADRYARDLARNDATTRARLDRARAWLRPGDGPQERTLNWAAFGPAIGPEALVARLVDAATPFDPVERTLCL